MKRLFFALLILVSGTCFAQFSSKQAMELLQESVSKFSATDNYVIDMALKVSIAPTIDMTVYWRKDRCAIKIDGGMSYYHDNTMWEYDEEDNEIVISDMGKDEMDKMAAIAILPASFKTEMKVIDAKSFKTDKATFTFEVDGNDVEYTTKKDGAKLIITINSKTRNISKLKLKKGLVSMNLTYKKIVYSCSEESATFNKAKYPTATIKDKRKKKK